MRQSFNHHQSHLTHCHQTLPLHMREKHPPCHICLQRLQPPQPGPVIINDQEEYEAEEVLDSRFRWGKLWYLVKFIGWSHSDNMWFPHSEVHAPAVVEEFHLRHPDSPHSSSPSTPTTSRCPQHQRDRKSTRLNSSHQIISYAVFCLKKKKIDPTYKILDHVQMSSSHD